MISAIFFRDDSYESDSARHNEWTAIKTYLCDLRFTCNVHVMSEQANAAQLGAGSRGTPL